MDEKDAQLLRDMGVSPERIAELLKKAEHLKQGKEQMFEKIKREKGPKYAFMTEIACQMYSITAIVANLHETANKAGADKDRTEHSVNTIIHIIGQVLQDLHTALGLSGDEGHEVMQLAEKFVEHVFDVAQVVGSGA